MYGQITNTNIEQIFRVVTVKLIKNAKRRLNYHFYVNVRYTHSIVITYLLVIDL